ncbi:MAG: hypothetical protein CR988_00590 [Treponema sp.]|nr:MAG: hypothetical protein CR988_00590 [Treponema sp.]
MIKIAINGEKLDFKIENEKTIGDVMGEVEEFCNSQNNTVFSIFSNEREIKGEEIDKLFALPVTEELSIELFTKSGDDIKEQVMEIGKDLTDISMSLEEIPVKMQTGDDAFAISVIEKFSQKFVQLCRYLSLHKISGISVETKIDGQAVQDYQKEISELLTDITTALEEKDIISVGDIAEYELSPLAKKLGNGLISL